MKGNTPLARTTVKKIYNTYLAVVPFDDGSSLRILLTKDGRNNIQPCTSEHRFIYESVSEEIRLKINKLIEESM